MGLARYVACMVEERRVYKVLVGNTEGKKTFGRPMHRWDYGIRVDLEEIGCGGVEWIQLAQYMFRWRAVVNAVMNLSLRAPRSQSVQTRYKKY
jgi:hypothetical protein